MSRQNNNKTTDSDRKRVVIADDDRFVRALLENRLSAMGCETFEAEDGARAWELILETMPAIAFVDLDMPEVDGFELIERVRAHPRTSHMPLVVITSANHQSAIDRAFSAGATSFLLKPIRWSVFEAHVRYLMRLTSAAERAETELRRASATLQIAGTSFRKAFLSSRADVEEIRVLLQGLLERLTGSRPPDASDIEILENAKSLAEGVEADLLAADDINASIANAMSLQEEAVPFNLLLAAAVERSAVNDEGPSLDLKVPDQMFEIDVFCDRESIALALANLIDNALIHAGADARVILEAKLYEDLMLSMTVADNGEGMSSEYLAEIMDPLRAAPAGLPGNIGLPLTRALVEANGGRLEIRTAPGSGTSATISMPPGRILLDCSRVA